MTLPAISAGKVNWREYRAWKIVLLHGLPDPQWSSQSGLWSLHQLGTTMVPAGREGLSGLKVHVPFSESSLRRAWAERGAARSARTKTALAFMFDGSARNSGGHEPERAPRTSGSGRRDPVVVAAAHERRRFLAIVWRTSSERARDRSCRGSPENATARPRRLARAGRPAFLQVPASDTPPAG